MPAEFQSDPTAFAPMAVAADESLPIGFELEPVTKKITLDKARIYEGWPGRRSRHCDYDAAHADHFHMEIKPGVRWFLYH